MPPTSSAIDKLRSVAARAGAVTSAGECATAELKVPVAAVHGAATFYDDLAPTRRGKRHVRVCEGTNELPRVKVAAVSVQPAQPSDGDTGREALVRCR